ncbi:MAG TPA: ABC transporter ATP-binding protein [Clostridia bacterium]|nr:ABC transporter ATP-binding protein [Clostridia bacterium]
MGVLLQTKNISKFYGGIKAVQNIDMQVEEGEIFGIIGPNGAGKTSFFNVCTGNLQPNGGEVWFDGKNITGLRPARIATMGIARTFQNIQLFNFMTVLENVKIGFHTHEKTNIADAILHTKRYKEDERLTHEKAVSLIDRLGLTKESDNLAGNLAYGVQRRVEIARALALEPKILLLDEPAAGMNPIETRDLSDFIKQLRKDGHTIVVIEHDMKFVMNLCDRIMVINFGKKICEGGPAHVKADKEVNEAYFGKGTTF